MDEQFLPLAQQSLLLFLRVLLNTKLKVLGEEIVEIFLMPNTIIYESTKCKNKRKEQ